WLEIEPEIDDIITKKLLEPIDPFWASGNRQVMNGYRDVSLPFGEIPDLPPFSMKIEWNVSQLSAYLRTWSAVKRYITELGHDPVDKLDSALKTVWNEDETKIVQMPLFFKATRKPG